MAEQVIYFWHSNDDKKTSSVKLHLFTNIFIAKADHEKYERIYD
jgi:hypothetical protein